MLMAKASLARASLTMRSTGNPRRVRPGTRTRRRRQQGRRSRRRMPRGGCSERTSRLRQLCGGAAERRVGAETLGQLRRFPARRGQRRFAVTPKHRRPRRSTVDPATTVPTWTVTTWRRRPSGAASPLDELRRLVELGIITPDAGGRFTPGHLRRAGLVREPDRPRASRSTVSAPPSGAARSRSTSSTRRHSSGSRPSAARPSPRSPSGPGCRSSSCMFIREAAGSVAPHPDDRIRDEELPYVELIETAVRGGFRRPPSSR